MQVVTKGRSKIENTSLYHLDNAWFLPNYRIYTASRHFITQKKARHDMPSLAYTHKNESLGNVFRCTATEHFPCIIPVIALSSRKCGINFCCDTCCYQYDSFTIDVYRCFYIYNLYSSHKANLLSPDRDKICNQYRFFSCFYSISCFLGPTYFSINITIMYSYYYYR